MSSTVFVQTDESGPPNKGNLHNYPPQYNVDDTSHQFTGPPPPYFQVYEGSTSITEELVENPNDFSDKVVRNGFLRKVFTTLSIQVFVTFVLVAIFTFVPAVKKLLIKDQDPEGVVDETNIVSYVAGAFLIIDFVCIVLITIQPKWMNVFCWSYIFLGFVTICFGASLAILSIFVPSKFLLYITGMTLSGAITMTLFTFQSSYELTPRSGFLLAIGAVGITGVLMYFAVPVDPKQVDPDSDPVDQDGLKDSFALIFLAGIVAVGFALFWVYFLEKMMLARDTGRISKSPDEFVLAAIYLYVGTVLMFFMFIVALVVVLILLRFRVCIWYSTRTEGRVLQTERV